jgi:hypothetical protein
MHDSRFANGNAAGHPKNQDNILKDHPDALDKVKEIWEIDILGEMIEEWKKESAFDAR